MWREMEALDDTRTVPGASHVDWASAPLCLLVNIPIISYFEALKLQLDLHSRCASGDIPGALLLLEHHPVITMGVKTSKSNILLSEDELRVCGIKLVKTDRGGDVTYHGPGQLVGYPILRLRELGLDLHAYLRALEASVILTLAEFGLEGTRKGLAGVWVGDKKVCSIGVAVRKWVTYHGFALNVCPDLSHFSFINPCGLSADCVTSLAEILPDAPDMATVRDVYARCFASTFGVQLDYRPGDEL